MDHVTSARVGCSPNGPMGGTPGAWSPCSVMDFRRMYSKYSNDWCLEGKWGLNLLNVRSCMFSSQSLVPYFSLYLRVRRCMLTES